MKSIKRIFAIVMIMAMMLSLVAINASASVIRVESDNTCSAVLDSGTASYDAVTNTLTLDNAKITSSGTEPAINVQKSGDIKIVVKGDCELTSPNSYAGIYSNSGNLTIVGEDDASLTIKVKCNDGGILCYSGSLTIKDLTLAINNIGTTTTAKAINNPNGDVIIENSTVTINSTGTKFEYGIYADVSGDIIFKNCVDSSIDVDKYGIYSRNGSVEISGSKFTSITNTASTGVAIQAYNGVKISNSTLASVVSNGTYAIFAQTGKISFTGKDIVDVKSEGIAVSDNDGITFDMSAGSKVHATAVESAFASTNVTIDLGNSTITLPVGGTVERDVVVLFPMYTIGKDGVAATEATVEVPLKDYEIAQTKAELTWEKGCCDVLTVTSNAEFNKFSKILVDDVEVLEQDSSKDYKNYYVMSGSTKVLLSAGYLETLAVGDHTIEIVSNDGSAKGTFTIVEAAKKEEPEKVADTADNSAFGAFVALGAFAALGYVSLKKKED